MNQEVIMDKALESELQELSGHYKDKEANKIEWLRHEFAPIIEEIDALEKEATALESQAKTIRKSIDKKLDEIRMNWQPFIAGVEKAQIGFDNERCLVAERVLTITTEDNDKALKWFMDNDYKDVMKWQIHDQTKKKIARDHYAKGEEIPGLNYSKFLVVKVK